MDNCSGNCQCQTDQKAACACENEKGKNNCCGGNSESCVNFKEQTGNCCNGALCKDEEKVEAKTAAKDDGCCGGGNCCG